jgi:proteasome lid subunit RPN8/RPN11
MTVTLTLTGEHLAAIRRHGEATYPHECCGFLVGRADDRGRTALRLFAADNERTDSARNRYLISPESYLKAELSAEAAGLEVIGFYHSHPDAPAAPSEFDREHALPGCSYVIVSVREGKARELTSWVLAEDRSRFISEPLVESGG